MLLHVTPLEVICEMRTFNGQCKAGQGKKNQGHREENIYDFTFDSEESLDTVYSC